MRTYVAFFAGIFRLPYPTFLIYNLAGSIVWSITFGLLGYFIGNNLNLLYTILTDFKELVIGGFVLFAAYLLVQKYFRSRKRQ
jgi:membrane protein DedA with SNARE-associated domain